MRSTSLAAALVLAVLAPPSLRGGELRLASQALQVPAGFEIELIAGPPLVDRPIEADFDDQGRLYVTDSSGSNAKPDAQLKDPSHRVLRLEDTDGDGKLDRRTVFADKLPFPEGCMWLDGALYVAAPPSIWKLVDTDGDGTADQRIEWFQGKTLTGCANDLHGPYRGPDGWIYWAKGAFAEQTYERPGKKPFVTRAAHIFRARPGEKATGIEPVMTGGMDNPVGVVFTPGGERIFTTTFLQNPEGGRRDGLIHAVYGGVYGKPNDAVDGHPRTGELMPILTHLGPAAPCGLARYESGVFGEEYRDNLFACLFNLHKVTRHVLEPDGATFRTRDTDFVTSDSTDFHPTDVLEATDGSLIVVDTGGWYKLCCPTSQLSKPDVLGGIYRVRKTGAPARAAVRPRRVVAGSIETLSGVLRTDSRAAERRDAVWALTRIDSQDARAAVRAALADSDETVRCAAVHSASVWRDQAALDALLGLLPDRSLHVVRATAEALGRLGDRRATPALLAAASTPRDRVLEHSLFFALIEIADRSGTAAGLTSESPSARRAALIALDQMDGGDLRANAVTPLLRSPEPGLRQAALWIVSRHQGWGDAVASFLQESLAARDLTAGDRQELEGQLGRFARSSSIQGLIASTLSDPAAPRESRETALRAMTRAELKEPPAAWIEALTAALGDGDPAVASLAVASAKRLPPAKKGFDGLAAALLRVARDGSRSVDSRLDALAAIPGGLASVEPDCFALLVAAIDPERSATARATAANVLARARLGREQLLALAAALRTAGPLEIPSLLPAFEKSTDEAIGQQLLAALEQSPSASGLRGGTIHALLASYPDSVKKQGEALIAQLHTDAAQQKARLDELAESLKSGDVRRGQAVFNGTKAACATCHAIGYLGGKIGPDLTTIGTIRTERDLLESIVYPSESFVRSYEPLEVVTTTGQVFSGIIKSGGADELVLTTGFQAEARIARSEIAEMRPGTVSVMPGGLDQQLSRQELADLLAFLKATKWGS